MEIEIDRIIWGDEIDRDRMDRTDGMEELQLPGQLMRIKGPKCENHRMICGDLAVSCWRRRRRSSYLMLPPTLALMPTCGMAVGQRDAADLDIWYLSV
ncbi:hypothetical protein R1flu_006340 [Riccia fluitans]|uniref:Uncharacterized protein n=1 Tax=Riccia fluitans TaxID=41844 RepID=A0ABD1YVR4_9MARC